MAMLLLEHARTLDAPAHAPGLRLRPGRRGDPDGARRASIPATIAADVSEERLRALLHQGAARLPGAARAARDGPLRRARPAQGRAVLAHGPDLLPQPAHLPQPRRAGTRAGDLPLRAASRTGCSSWARRRRWRKAARSSPRWTRSTASTCAAPAPRVGLPVPHRARARSCAPCRAQSRGKRRSLPRPGVHRGADGLRRRCRRIRGLRRSGRRWRNCTSG